MSSAVSVFVDSANSQSLNSPPSLAVNLSETLLLLCNNETLMAPLRLALAARKIQFQRFFSSHSIMINRLPTGPTCLVVDLDFEEGRGLSVCEQLKARGHHLPMVVVAVGLDMRRAVCAMRAGAEDILTRDSSPDEFSATIDRALALARRMLQFHGPTEKMQHRLALLTAREYEVIKLVVAGMLNKEIAHKLQLALVTVKMHRGHAMRKLGARNAAELAQLAFSPNIFAPPHRSGPGIAQSLHQSSNAPA